MNATPGLLKDRENLIYLLALLQDRLSGRLVNRIAPASRCRGCMV
jgi:hypothetical protein